MRLQHTASLLLAATLSVAAPTENVERNNGCSTGVSASRAAQIKSAFTSSGVVPTLIPSINPKLEVSVKYGNKAVNLGNEFTTLETVSSPKLTFNAEADCEPAGTTYSYFLVDPDVPNQDAGALRMNFLHWYVSGAQPYCVTDQKPQTVTIYEPLTPASTSQHRYTFLVYREPKGYTPDVVTAQVRVGFDINAYAAKAGLTLVGGNFLREAITNGVLPPKV